VEKGVLDVMDITARRAQRAADDGLVGRALCRAWTDDVDGWLAELVEAALARDVLGGRGGEGAAPVAPVALVAVGGYGRRELSLQSDLDLMLVHGLGRNREGLAELADAVWYPIWDAGLRPWRWPPTTSTPPPRCSTAASSPATPRSPPSWPRRPSGCGGSGPGGSWA
jgi:UTP:GlnB (protein PII) uridylyltransferase